MLYPLSFRPIFKERIWGGKYLETHFQKSIPPDQFIGESWELSDRIGDVSAIVNGRLAGSDLHWLMQHHSIDILGTAKCMDGRFPLLCKILDSREKLSLQVHPPATLAGPLGGQPKTEMWYIAHAEPQADIFLGFRNGITREQFAQAMHKGDAAECIHRKSVQAGNAVFIPSGRVHGLGAGNVIFEIQQNSDTTYRVFDWNRVGLDGKPRELHIEQAMQCIDFRDFEPPLISQISVEVSNGVENIPLVNCEAFDVSLYQSAAGGDLDPHFESCLVVASVGGKAIIHHPTVPLTLPAGAFGLIPACLKRVEITLEPHSKLLVAKPH